MRRQSLAWLLLAASIAAAAQKAAGPAAWGSNHAGQDVPEYVHGDECLFCHRFAVGTEWQKNAHGATIRQAEDAPELGALLAAQPALASVAPQVNHFLGSRRYARFLHQQGYGKFALLNTKVVLGPDGKAASWINLDHPAWDKDRFAARCAGCHATGVDARTAEFTAFGLDCYVCHGVVSLDHSKDTSLVWLSKKHTNDARSVVSICAQCHLRGGRSKSTGLTYANNFIAGDNLFQDYTVDFAKADDLSLNPGDRHVFQNVRDVVLGGGTTTCLSCHRIHEQSARKHRLVLSGPICLDCHNETGPKKAVKTYAVHSEVCEY